MKKIIAVFLCVMTLTIGASAVSANQAKEPSFWYNTGSISVSLHFNNDGKGTMSGTVIGDNDVTLISVDAVLERINSNGTVTHIHSWYDIEAAGDVWFWAATYYVTEGYTYRCTLYATGLTTEQCKWNNLPKIS